MAKVVSAGSGARWLKVSACTINYLYGKKNNWRALDV